MLDGRKKRLCRKDVWAAPEKQININTTGKRIIPDFFRYAQ
jgi:hypothetical protein